MNSVYKNIIFDLGHVLLRLNFERAEKQFQALLKDDFEKVYHGLYEEGHFLHYELGRFEESFFTEKIRLATHQDIKEEEIISAWNAMLAGIPKKRLDMLRRLKKEYQVFLLSNTNATHINWLDQHLREVHNINIQLFHQDLFHNTYYSHILHMRKPNSEIYEFVLQDVNLNPKETLFIDDLEDNILAAQKLGINGYVHKPEEEIADKINDLIV